MEKVREERVSERRKVKKIKHKSKNKTKRRKYKKRRWVGKNVCGFEGKFIFLDLKMVCFERGFQKWYFL